MKKVTAVFFLLGVWPVHGQQGTTAELTGIVTTSGQALPGVNITLASNQLQGNRVAISGDNGGYLFTLLPPADYLLRAELEGFSPIQKRIRMPLGAIIRLDFELRPATVRESLTVEPNAAQLGESTSIGMTIRGSELQRLPGGRDIFAATLLSGNTGSSGPRNRIVIAGAPSWDSLFLVDGVLVNEYLTGQPHDLFIEDAIEEIAILHGATSAEYGRFAGGVVMTLMKSGGNEFHGSIRDASTNPAWTGRTPWPSEPKPLDHWNQSAEGTLGGFLLRDRLWFFAAARKSNIALRRFTAFTNIPYQTASREQRWQGKVTLQVGPAQSLIASYVDTSMAETNVIDFRSAGRVLDLASLIPERSQPATLAVLTYEGGPARNTIVEARGSAKRYALQRNGGRSADRILGTLIIVKNVPALLNAPFGCGICGDDRRDSSSWAATASHYTNTRWGNHTLIAGVDDFHEQRFNRGTRSVSEFTIFAGSVQSMGSSAFPRFDRSTSIDWTRPYSSMSADFNSWSTYFDDRWDLNRRLTVTLGGRFDRNEANDAVGQRIADDRSFSPRVSATFDLRNNGRHRLFAGFGRYTSKILEGGGASQQIGTFTEFGWRYGGPPINPLGTPSGELLSAHEALASLFAWFDSVGGIHTGQPLTYFTDPMITSRFPASLRSPAVDEWSIGYGLQMHSGYIRADYLARDWKHFYAARVDTTTGQASDPQGNKVDVAWVINNDSGTTRTYRAAVFQGLWRRDRVSVGGSYTFSKLRGNDDGEEGTLSSPQNLPLKLWYPEFLGYARRRPIGFLQQDQRHRARVWSGYTMPLARSSINVELLQRFESGRAYSAAGQIDPTGIVTPYDGVPVNPGYRFNQISTGAYFFTERGAFRTDNLFSTDLALNCEVPLQRATIVVKGDVLNLLNHAAVVSPDTTVVTRLSGGVPTGLRAFNPFTQTPIEGIHYRLSPTFGKATGPESYQTPRTFQLSLGARF